MFQIFHKSREYPIIRDEYGRSARRQAFDLFIEGYRPSQIFKENLIPVSMKTLLRYFEDWKKQKHRTSRSVFRKIMMQNPEFTEKYVQMLADYFEVPPEDIIVRMQKPWGITDLSKGELPDRRLYRIQSAVEERLELALRFIHFGERLCDNSPEQNKRLLQEIVTLKDSILWLEWTLTRRSMQRYS